MTGPYSALLPSFHAIALQIMPRADCVPTRSAASTKAEDRARAYRGLEDPDNWFVTLGRSPGAGQLWTQRVHSLRARDCCGPRAF